MTKIRWVSYKDYSGFVASGGPKVEGPVDPTSHVDRAVFLAGQLESGSWGTVQGYDGCAMSGGILHNIAVSPKDLSQGTFFALLREVFTRAPTASKPVTDALAKVGPGGGWKVAPDGKLRVNSSGILVSGSAIRAEFSGSSSGAVARSGPDADQAKRWAELFATLFAHPKTYAAQSDYAARWLAEGNKSDELDAYNLWSMDSVNLDSIIGVKARQISAPIDLAMCVYHAYSVNAPGIARQVLRPLLSIIPTSTREEFAKRLIRNLGKSSYGNWQDSLGDGSNRYDKTRKIVWAQSSLWDTALAKSLMPRDLV